MSPFPANSRYRFTETRAHRAADGRTIVHLKRRFVPQPEEYDAIAEHVLLEGERLDHVAAEHQSDPELFWQLCDANRVSHPSELEDVGRRLRITLPRGIPAPRTS